MVSISLNILYVEDNLGDKVILEEHLVDIVQLKSFVHTTSIKGARKVLKKTSFDLIFIDLSLPDASGVDGVVQLIEATESTTPIIVLTGLNNQTIAINSLKEGAQDFLVKGDYTTVTLSKTIQYSIERHKVQLELINKNQEILKVTNRLSKAEELAELGSWEINLKNKLVKLSNGMNRLLGLDANLRTLELSDFAMRVYKDDSIDGSESLVNIFTNFKSSEIEIDFITMNGDIIFTLCKTEIRLNKEGKPIEIQGITLDISRIKEAEKVKEEFTQVLAKKVTERTIELEKTKVKLEESLLKEKELGELKSRFVSTASHQFRTPLTVIQSNIGLLELQTKKTNPEYLKIVEKITGRVKGEVRRMTNIINEVLILGKVSSGTIIPKFKEESIVLICTQVVNQYNEIQDDGRNATVKINGKEKKVWLDANLFEQAISNLISNAFKYSKGKKPPKLSIFFGDHDVEIVVEDKGMGIPETDLKNLFTPFFRASNVLDIPGNGLGTAIMKEYIELNRGTITAASILNKGTVFSINFKTD